MTTYSGNAYLSNGEATVYLPTSANTIGASVLVSPYFLPQEDRIPVVAATKVMGSMFIIRELNHAHCEVAWQVTTFD